MQRRILIAFLTAPFCVLAVPLLYFLLTAEPSPGAYVIAIVSAGACSYGVALIFGLPLFYLFKALSITDVSVALLTGLILGLLANPASMIAFWITSGETPAQALMSVRDAFSLQIHGPEPIVWTVAFGFVGAASALIFWLIARPDRQPSN